MPPRKSPRPVPSTPKTDDDVKTLDFGSKDDGLIRVILFGISYDISPTREILWINGRVREAIIAAGKSVDDITEFTPERVSEATREWIRKITNTDASYELALAVYNKLDAEATGRLDFFGIGPSSQPVLE